MRYGIVTLALVLAAATAQGQDNIAVTNTGEDNTGTGSDDGAPLGGNAPAQLAQGFSIGTDAAAEQYSRALVQRKLLWEPRRQRSPTHGRQRADWRRNVHRTDEHDAGSRFHLLLGIDGPDQL